jgi:hypothetical protein
VSVRRPNSLAANRVLQTDAYHLPASRFGPGSAKAARPSRTLNQTAKRSNSPMQPAPQRPLSFCVVCAESQSLLQASASIRRPNSLAANRVLQTDAYHLPASRFGPASAKTVRLLRTLNQTAKRSNSPMQPAPQRPLSYCGFVWVSRPALRSDKIYVALACGSHT